MPTFSKLLKAEIERVVSRQVAAMGVVKQMRKLAREVANLDKRLASVEAKIASGKLAAGGKRVTVKVGVDKRKLKFSPAALKSLRYKLNVTQQEVAKLLGVSGNAVWQWEAGRAKPRLKALEEMRKLRKIGSREARKRLEK